MATWSGWSLLGAVPDVKNVGACLFGGEAFVFANALTGHVYMNRLRSSGWTGWSDVSGGEWFIDKPGVAVFDQEIWLFSGTPNGRRYRRFDGSSWTGWRELPAANDEAWNGTAVAAYQDELHIFTISASEGVYTNRFDGTNWSGWSPLSSHQFARSEPAVTVVYPNNELRLYAKSRDHDILYERRYNGVSWSAWKSIGDTPPAAGPAVAGFTNKNDLAVFVKFGYDAPTPINHHFYTKTLTNGSWPAWGEVPPGGFKGIGSPAVVDAGNVLRLFAVGSDQKVWENSKFD